MSQFFIGIPLGKKRVLFIDSMLTLAISFALLFVGGSSENNMMIASGVFLLAFALLNPIRMSVMFPTATLVYMWNDEEEEKQQ